MAAHRGRLGPALPGGAEPARDERHPRRARALGAPGDRRVEDPAQQRRAEEPHQRLSHEACRSVQLCTEKRQQIVGILGDDDGIVGGADQEEEAEEPDIMPFLPSLPSGSHEV